MDETLRTGGSGGGAAPDGAPEVSVIVVSYNTRRMTLEAIASARRETAARIEVIAVDNASTDGSAEAIAARFPDIRLIAETRNLGFARANNIAARAARGEYLLLLNPDTVVLPGAIDALLAFARRRPEARIWGGRTFFADGRLNPTNCWAQMSLASLALRVVGLSSLFPGSRLLNPEGYGGWARDTEARVDIVTGCFLLIGRGFWEALGGFDERFVVYGEEADLCRRAVLAGAAPTITPDAGIVHHGGASSTVVADKHVLLLRAKISMANRLFAGWRRRAAVGLVHALAASRALGARITGRQAVWREVWARRSDWSGGWEGAPGAGGGGGGTAPGRAAEAPR